MYTTLDLQFSTSVAVGRDNITITQESPTEDVDMVVLYANEIDAFIDALVEAKRYMEKK